MVWGLGFFHAGPRGRFGGGRRLTEVVGCGQNGGGGEGWLGRVGGGGEEPALERSGDADPVVVSP
jgi:hypothetical protein